MPLGLTRQILSDSIQKVLELARFLSKKAQFFLSFHQENPKSPFRFALLAKSDGHRQQPEVMRSSPSADKRILRSLDEIFRGKALLGKEKGGG